MDVSFPVSVDLKKKFTYLRSKFMKDWRKQGKSGSEATNDKQWEFFHALEFLAPDKGIHETLTNTIPITFETSEPSAY